MIKKLLACLLAIAMTPFSLTLPPLTVCADNTGITWDSANLIQNGGFEDGTFGDIQEQGWDAGSSVVVNSADVPGCAHSGDYAMQHDVPVTSAADPYGPAYRTMYLEAGSKYKFSVWVKLSDPVNTTVVALNVGGNGVLALDTGGAQVRNTSSTDYLQLDYEFTAGSDLVYLEVYRYGGTPGGYLYLDDFELQKEYQAPPVIEEGIYVSPGGSDSNPGTYEAPFRTIEKAQEAVRSLNADMSGDINVYLRGGTYYQKNPLEFTGADSGTNGHMINYQAFGNEKPVISGGVDFMPALTKVDGQDYYEADISDIISGNGITAFRSLYVNGERAERARMAYSIRGNGYINYNSANGTADGFTVPKKLLPQIANSENGDMELSWVREWIQYNFIIGSITDGGANWNINIKPATYYAQKRLVGALFASGPNYSFPFWLSNALEFLTQPGQWYYDKSAQELYYYPLPGENVNQLNFTIPVIDELVDINGQDFDAGKVQNISFNGITFAYSDNQFLNDHGFQVHQTTWIIPDEALPAAVMLNRANNISFTGDVFEHIGRDAIGMGNGVSNVTLKGNVIKDISGNGILMGTVYVPFTNQYTATTYLMESEIPGEVEAPDNILISDNVISGVGREISSATGIAAMFAKNSEISHNDISDVPAQGISFGYGWAAFPDSTTIHSNKILNNKISDIGRLIHDAGAGIYTLGRQGLETGDGSATLIEGNYISASHNGDGSVYTDNGSKHIHIIGNVIDTSHIDNGGPVIYLHDDSHDSGVDSFDLVFSNNFYTQGAEIVNNCPNHSTLENNVEVPFVAGGSVWPAEARAIIDNAGLEADYQNLLYDRFKPRDGTELLSNPGFEAQSEWESPPKPMTWNGIGGQFTYKNRSDYAPNVNSGESAGYLYYRDNEDSAFGQDVTGALSVNGQGFYQIKGSMRSENSDTIGQITLRVCDSAGYHDYSLQKPINTTSFTGLTKSFNVQWTGQLKYAWFMVDTYGGKKGIVADDCSLRTCAGIMPDDDPDYTGPKDGSSFESENLITNPGFEEGTLDGYDQSVLYLSIVNGAYCPEGVHGGNFAAEHDAPAATAGDFTMAQVIMNLKPNTHYKFSVWMKLTNPADTVAIQVAGALTGWNNFSSPLSGTTDWQKLSVEFTTGDSADTQTWLVTNRWGATPGRPVYIDDFELVEVIQNQQSNLIPNSGFEEGTLNGYDQSVPYLSIINRTDCPEGVHNGNFAAEHDSPAASASDFTMAQVIMNLKPDTHYKFSVWMKLTNPADTVAIQVAGPLTGWGNFSAPLTGTTDWQQLSIEFTTGSSGDPQTWLVSNRWGATPGMPVYIDDFELVEIVPVNPDNLIPNPGFEDGSTGSFDRATPMAMVNAADNPFGVHSGNFAISFDVRQGGNSATEYNGPQIILPLKANTRYRYSVWVRLTNPNDRIKLYTGGTARVLSENVTGTTDWTKISVEFVTNSAGGQTWISSWRTGGVNGEPIYFDDYELYEIDQGLLNITTESLPDGYIDEPYSQQLSAQGIAPVKWTIMEKSLPNGLTLSENGVISGTPSATGTFLVDIRVENNEGFDAKEFSITVNAKPLPEVDKTALEALIAQVESSIADKAFVGMTAASVAALQEALDAAKAVDGDANATQARVNDAHDNLLAAYDRMSADEAKATLNCTVKSMLAKVAKLQKIPYAWDGAGPLIFTTSNTAVCGVTPDGTLVPLKAGIAVITITAPNGVKVVFAVTVTA